MAIGWREQYTRYREFYLNIQSLYKQRADLRAFLEIILSISTVIIFLVFALKPTALTIISLYGQIQEKQKTVAGLNQKIADLQTASRVFTASQNLIPDVDAAISSSPQPDIITEQVQALAAKDSVTVLGISIGSTLLAGTSQSPKSASTITPLPGGAHEMSISISTKGDYAGLNSFLKDLENLRTIVNLDTLGINSSDSEKGKTIVSIISGRVPYLGN